MIKHFDGGFMCESGEILSVSYKELSELSSLSFVL
jgi:hypothetical protein